MGISGVENLQFVVFYRLSGSHQLGDRSQLLARSVPHQLDVCVIRTALLVGRQHVLEQDHPCGSTESRSSLPTLYQKLNCAKSGERHCRWWIICVDLTNAFSRIFIAEFNFIFEVALMEYVDIIFSKDTKRFYINRIHLLEWENLVRNSRRM